VVADAVRIAAHAKVNLFLRILARETSGFHQIETAFALLELSDELVVRRTPRGVTIAVAPGAPDLGDPDENLAARAARAVLEATGQRFGVAIELTKRIPVRAGLGGGSSDAAAALHGRALAGCRPPRRAGADGRAIGSDASLRAALALGWGRGERIPQLDRARHRTRRAGDRRSRRTPTGGGTNECDQRHGGRGADAPALATWEASAAWAGTISSCRSSGTIPPCVRCSSGSWRRILIGYVCAVPAAHGAVYSTGRLRDDAAMQLGSQHQQLVKTSTRARVAPGPEALTP
jgi:hypothetical protein